MMASSESSKSLKRYSYPANMYKMVYPESISIDKDKINRLMSTVRSLPKGYKYVTYLYFYEKLPYFDVGLKLKVSSTKARAIILEVVGFLAGKNPLGKDIEIYDEVVYPSAFLELLGELNISFAPKKESNADTSSNSEPRYIPPKGNYTYLDKIGTPHDDYWTGSMNHSNRNVTNASEGKYDARMSSFEKKERVLINVELDYTKPEEGTSEREKFDGIAIKDSPYPVCKYWPSNLISRIFSSGYRMPITEDQYVALNKYLLEIKDEDPTSLVCLLLVYMYDQQYSRISIATGLQPYVIKKKVSSVIRFLSSSKCKGYLYYGLEGFKNRKSGTLEESQQKNLLYCSTFSAGIVEQFAKALNIHTMDELLDSSARDLVVGGNFPNAALSEIYTVLYHAGYETFHDGHPLSDLVSVGKVRYYRGRGNTERTETAAATEGA